MKKRFLFAILLIGMAAPPPAADDGSRHFNYIQDLYNLHDKKLAGYLLRELEQFTEAYPQSENIVDAHYFIAKVRQENKQPYAAFAAFFETVFLYPNSHRHADCAAGLRELLRSKKDLRDVAAQGQKALGAAVDAPQEADRYFRYLTFLRSLPVDHLHRWSRAAANRFRTRFPEDSRLAEIQMMIADFYRLEEKAREAAAAYLKLEYIAPESGLLPEAKFRRSVLLYKKLGEPGQAKQVLTEVAQKYGESDYAPEALFLLGEIKARKDRDYTGAIIEYRHLADLYPNYDRAAEALWRAARLNVKRLNDYAAGIATFNEIAEKYPNDSRAISALAEVAKVYRTKLKDDDRAAATLAKIAEAYPNFETSPDFLLNAASIMEKNDKNFGKAVAYYERFLEKYPDHRKAGRARKRLEKVKKKLAAEKS